MSTLSVYTLSEIRTRCQQQCDMVNSTFITDAEWNGYINDSIFELWDLLTTHFGEDYSVAAPTTITTDGTNFQYSLSSDFYKMIGVEALLMGSSFFVPIKSFAFGDRSPNYYIGAVPASGQQVRIWYNPRFTELSGDNSTFDGISGWTEYVIADVNIKALGKEESDTTLQERRKMALLKRIEDSAANRDAANPITVTDSQAQSSGWPFAISSLYAPNILRYSIKGSKIWLINYGLGAGNAY